jgi:hypothetical protein
MRVFLPLPLPNSATCVGVGMRDIIPSAWRCSKRESARVNPYSGSRQIASKSCDPTSSYKYLLGNSRWPILLRPSRTSAANSDTTFCEGACTIISTPKGQGDLFLR